MCHFLMPALAEFEYEISPQEVNVSMHESFWSDWIKLGMVMDTIVLYILILVELIMTLN